MLDNKEIARKLNQLRLYKELFADVKKGFLDIQKNLEKDLYESGNNLLTEQFNKTNTEIMQNENVIIYEDKITEAIKTMLNIATGN